MKARRPQARPLLLAIAAALVEVAAAWSLLCHGQLAAAVALHMAASLLAALTVDRAMPAYRDAVLLTAVAVPLLGPMLAWAVLARPRDAAVNAHAFFENYEQEVQGRIELQGTVPDSDARTISFHEVLRHGSLDHRRNALRKLAQRGQRMHLQLLRRCLSHPDMELRLGAFTELNRLLREWETRLDELRAAVARTPRDADARAAASRAHREYAASGLLDDDMARFQLEQAAAACDLTMVPTSGQTDLAVERALVFAELGDLDGAVAALGHVDGPDRDAPHACIARARIAFLTRRYSEVHPEVDRLRAAEADVPRWMSELCSTLPAAEEVAR